MNRILQLNNSIFGDHGESSQLADHLVSRLARQAPDARVTRRDLAASPLPHITQGAFSAALTPPGERTPEQARQAAHADTLIEELEANDVLVIAAPVYNFNVASTLKAWFDHVARAGRTFRYTAEGSQGLLENKKAYVLLASAGAYEGSAIDFPGAYLRHMLAFLGIEDVEIVRAEGLAFGDNARQEALDEAQRRIEALAA